MKLKFTYHSQYRITVERNLSIEDIKRIIKNPDYHITTGDGLDKSMKFIRGKRVWVVYKFTGKEYIIITSY